MTATKGAINVLAASGATMRLHVRKVDGRQRPWKVVIEAGSGGIVDQRMLATAPLVAAEIAANLPSEMFEIEGGTFTDLPQAPGVGELVVPEVRPYPRQFWEDVAALYVQLVLAHGVRNPAVAIAEETGAPVPTVRGWIAKCRTLGLIAKGSQGRLG
jgi:hypothetical protein